MKKVKTPEFAAFVGIDWSDIKHDVIMQEKGSDTYEYLVIKHSPEAIDDWTNQLRERFNGKIVAVCLEQRKGPLIYALLKYDHLCLFPINPQMLAKYRRAFSPSGAKDDPTDADLILDLLLNHRERLQVWLPDDPATREIRQLTESRRNMVSMRIRITNQLTANLKGYYTQALDCFESIDTILACDFLQKWDCLDNVKHVRQATLINFFRKHSVRSEDLINERIKRLKDAIPLTQDSGIIQPAIALTKALVAQLRPLLNSISDYDQLIADRFKVHPDAYIFDSLPAAGPVFAPRLLAAFGSNRERYSSAESVQKYGGIAPVTERSGKSTWVHWRYSCPTFIRQSFVEWAGMTMRYSYWADAYYRSQIEKGKSHNVAVRALAFKWIRIIFRCWKDSTVYDESKYLFSLRKNNSPILKYMSS